VFTGTAVSIGAIGGSVIGGLIGGAFSLQVLFGLAAVGSAVGAVLVWRAIGGRGTRASPAPSEAG
jgi:dipeptide/tripeptide permease